MSRRSDNAAKRKARLKTRKIHAVPHRLYLSGHIACAHDLRAGARNGRAG